MSTPGGGDTSTTDSLDDKGNGAASRREQRRLQHQDLSRNQLLDAAEEVFGAKGFHETTLKEVAELAEFSVGSVYSFFQNKDDLFLNVFLRRGAEFLPGMEAVQVSAGSALDQLHALVDFEISFFRKHPHFGRLFLRSSTTPLPPSELSMEGELGSNFQRSMEIQADVMRRGQKAGEIRGGDPYVLGRLLSGLVSSYQSLDPAVVSEGRDTSERLPLVDLHAMVDGAFRA